MSQDCRNINDLQKESLQRSEDGYTYRNVLNIASLMPKSYDAIDASYPNSVTEVYDYYQNGLAGTLVGTITITYTDATKDCINTAVRT